MIARRLIVSLVLLALVGNITVIANSSAGNMPNEEGQAFTLVSLKHETVGAQTRILIESSAPPLYTVFRPSDRLVVIDLPGGEASALSPEYSVKNALVDLITVRQSKAAATSSRLVARIEVAVRSDVRDRSTLNGNTLVIELSPAKATADQPQQQASNAPIESKNRARAANLKSGAEPATSGVEVFPAPTVAKSGASKASAQPVADRAPVRPDSNRAAASNPLRPATLVRAVRSEVAEGGVRIWVHTDGAAQFKDFLLNDPWRVVVDITGVRSEFGNKTAAVGAGVVDRVRVGQPSDKVVRVVLDTKSKVPYRVEREGESLVITVGNFSEPKDKQALKDKQAPAETKAQSSANPVKEVAQPASKTNSAQSSSGPEVKVAGERVEKDAKSAASNPAKQASESHKQSSEPPSNLLAQAGRPSSGQATPPRVTPQPNRTLPLPTQPSSSSSNSVKETVTHTAQPTYTRSAMDVQPTQPATSHNNAPPSNQNAKKRGEMAFCDAGFVGGLISFDLRAGVDMRDMLRFVSKEYGVNFIVDKSVSAVPVDIRVEDLPWNQVIESVMKANRLGAVCESNGRMIRIATLAAIKEEQDQMAQLAEAKAKQVPLVTKIVRLKYARATGALGDGGMGQSGRGSGGAGSAQTQGSLLSIINSRKSDRGRIEMEARTNSLIITDLPEYVQVMEDLIAKLDRPQPQVEIEARIVIASRNFLRDIGNELGAAAINTGQGATGFLQTTPLQLQPGGKLAPGGKDAGGSGGSGGSGGDSGSGSSEKEKGLGPNLVGPFADTALRAGVANTVLSLTTGLIGTSIISAALSASETKGQIRTIASPRVTATDNGKAEIVNGVQIPVQTVSNNTITTTFITAALRLEITPQIIEETGEVLMHVVAENNTVNFGLANQFNNGTPGINTQSAESTVRVVDGGTTVMGGINIDTEGHSVNRTPGVSRIPIVGHMFKRKTTRRDSDEILFFLTPRIVRSDGVVGPRTQRSSVEGLPNPAGPQRAASQSKPVQANAATNGKGGQ